MDLSCHGCGPAVGAQAHRPVAHHAHVSDGPSPQVAAVGEQSTCVLCVWLLCERQKRSMGYNPQQIALDIHHVTVQNALTHIHRYPQFQEDFLEYVRSMLLTELGFAGAAGQEDTW
jgi:hypothetical protein